MGLRVVRVERDRAAEHGRRLVPGADRGLAGELAPAQVELVGLEVARRVALAAPFGRAGEGALERLRDLARDLVLDREDVLEAPLPGLRPQVVAVAGTDQLRGHPHAVAGLAHAALEDRLDRELAADLARVDAAVAEAEGGRARGHAQAAHAAHRIDDLLGQPVAEPVLVVLGAEVGEGQDRDRGAALRGRRRDRAGSWRDDIRARGRGENGRRAHDPAGGVVVDPGQDTGEHEPGGHREDQRALRPRRQSQRLEGRVGDLQQQPAEDEVRGSDAEHAPAPEFAQRATEPARELVHGRLSAAGRRQGADRRPHLHDAAGIRLRRRRRHRQGSGFRPVSSDGNSGPGAPVDSVTRMDCREFRAGPGSGRAGATRRVASRMANLRLIAVD